MNLELIEWDDAWVEEGRHDRRTLKCAPAKTQSVGWIIEENKEGIILVPERWPDEQDVVNYPTFIPKKMITRRESLTIPMISQ